MKSKIEKSSYISDNVKIINSKIKNKAYIHDFSFIKSSIISDNVHINKNNTIIASIIGRHSYTNMNTIIQHAIIGNFCSISWNVSIGNPNHDYTRIVQHSFLYNDFSMLRPDNCMDRHAYNLFSEDCIIGNDVWIASGAVILRDITIGNGAVIGANAVVTHDVPPYAIVAGVPARIIKYRFSEDVIDILQQLCWWKWSDIKIKNNYHILSKQPNISELKQLLNQTDTINYCIST